MCLKPPAFVVLSESDTDADYHTHQIQGFSVHVAAEDASDYPEKAESVVWFMRARLKQMVEVIPLNKIKLLRQVDIWINDDWEEDDLCRACYVHQSYSSNVAFFNARAGDIIFRDFDILLDYAWCCTYGAVLHEMAHAYHDQFLEDGYYNDDIDDLYDDAVDSGDYESVRVMYPWWEDQNDEHYGLTNAREFYATMTETFFLGYRTFPHNIRDLHNHDRAAYNLILNSWYSEDIDGDVVSFSELQSSGDAIAPANPTPMP